MCDGLLFRSDDSFQSFADVLNDFKQMTKNPEAFIHLSVKDQWRVAFGDKLHGRSKEMKLIMDVACNVSGTLSNDALFEALALLLLQNKQQIAWYKVSLDQARAGSSWKRGRAWRIRVGCFLGASLNASFMLNPSLLWPVHLTSFWNNLSGCLENARFVNTFLP